MADKKLQLRVIAPGMNLGKDLPTHGDMVVVHAITGEMGILPGRLPCVMALGKGSLRIYEGETVYRLLIDGGIASISGDVVTVLSNSLAWADE
jgi:F0F1-type ATP synthase epsilon subunit